MQSRAVKASLSVARVSVARLSAACLAALGALTACSSGPRPSGDFPSQAWTYEEGREAGYLLGPGDRLEIIVHTAPELSRTVVVAPDGRIRVPLADPVMAAARTIEAVRTDVATALASQLLDPGVDVVPVEFAPQNIFVGGEVSNPGMFPLPGQVDPLQAILMAGGFTDTARRHQVIVMRRLADGEVRTAVFDVRAGLRNPELATWAPLRRYDVVYVPETAIGAENRFVQQYIRNALPIEFSLFYDISPER